MWAILQFLVFRLQVTQCKEKDKDKFLIEIIGGKKLINVKETSKNAIKWWSVKLLWVFFRG